MVADCRFPGGTSSALAQERHHVSPRRRGVADASQDGEVAERNAVRRERQLVPLAGDPEDVRERFPVGTERIVVWAYVADAPAGWEPALDGEHVEHRWLTADDAVGLLQGDIGVHQAGRNAQRPA